MNNSFARLIDGMNATLRNEVLPRLDDDFARGQVYGVINVLNTFKARADWSPGFLMQQIDAQRQALETADRLARDAGASVGLREAQVSKAPTAFDANALLRQRDALNRAISDWLGRLDSPGDLSLDARRAIESALRKAARAEVDIELRHSPRPLFAEISSGRE